MLCRAYSNPFDLMNLYIKQGRFGKFVEEFIKLENERTKEEREKETDNRLWIAYLLNGEKESYQAFKSRVMGNNAESNGATVSGDENLDDKGIQSILDSLFSNTKPQKQGGE